jgi:glycosyltransferase involved in cell wall biosynthesis
MLRIAIVTNVIPSYRRGFYERLMMRPDLELTVFCQDSLPGFNIRTIHHELRSMVRLVPFVGLRGERLVVQALPWRELQSKFDVVFVNGNPRILSHVALATLLHWRNRPVVLWTSARSWRNRRLSEWLRFGWMRMFRHILTYTDDDVTFLRARGFATQDLVGQNNGLDQSRIDRAASAWDDTSLEAWRHEHHLVGRRVVLSCARLDAKNRFDIWIKAMPAVVAKYPNLLWCVIGAGAESERLAAQARACGVTTHIRFLGEIYDEDALAPWFMSAEIAVHPAAIGLGVMHAFGYGLPLVTHGNARTHGPEFAAVKEAQTGVCYAEGDAEALGNAVSMLLADEALRMRLGNNALSVVRTTYNVDVMVERFVAIAYRAAMATRKPLT